MDTVREFDALKIPLEEWCIRQREFFDNLPPLEVRNLKCRTHGIINLTHGIINLTSPTPPTFFSNMEGGGEPWMGARECL